jgi:hypothetical protein
MVRYIFKSKDFPNLNGIRLTPITQLNIIRAIAELAAPTGEYISESDLLLAEKCFRCRVFYKVCDIVIGTGGSYKFYINDNGDVVGQWQK